MKRFLAFLTMLVLCSSAALAEEDLTEYAIANGNVTASKFLDVVAPYSGTLETFDLAVGDQVAAGDELMRMLVTTLYAPEDGVVHLRAAKGDDASAVINRYGALAWIEPEKFLQVSASSAGAYDKLENHILHIGELLYSRSNQSGLKKGAGHVIIIDANGYVVDLDEGDYDIGDTVNLYREDDYESRDQVGRGTVMRRSPVALMGAGRVCDLLVEEGSNVPNGTAIMTLMGADAAHDASPILTAPQNAVIASVPVQPGQQVWKGQLLARLYLTEELEVVAEVDEIDLSHLQVGDRLPMTLDMDEEHILYGTVTEISALGVTRQNATYYTVHVSVPVDESPLLGASVSVYLPRK